MPTGGPLARIVLVAAVAALLVGCGPSGYERLAERVGPERAERMLWVVIPVALAKHCHDAYGEDDAMVQTVAEYIVRNQEGMAELKQGPDGIDAMSEDEKLALEEEAMDRVGTMADSADACDTAAGRVAAGEFDL
jgi:hypothetical protein